ncbi:unnamed protein product [Aspergillus oryzae var. brunneus]|uniref:Unnamed protein product n=2 Tax=Aspergillus oryzae TaxID=5062 RepID=A0AAN5BVY8_ASPOZ|nr:unnamed protein product [Aspergillus oryzae]GMG35518.1 unnamed protein product [Aspergillus oryzae]GMG54366.1 unnamed protein product [Aspergillus oryzae var. brunneus]
MESIIAQAQSLAGEADGADQAKIRDALRQLLLELEMPKDMLMGIFNGVSLIPYSRHYTKHMTFTMLSLPDLRFSSTCRLPPFVSVSNQVYSGHSPKARHPCRWTKLPRKSGASPELFGKMSLQSFRPLIATCHI